MSSLSGHLLVASPYMGDQRFARSVVLLIDHRREGAMGLILNQPSGETVDQLWQKVAAGRTDCADRVAVGGPVSGPLIALHVERELADREVPPGIFVAYHKDRLRRLVEHGGAAFRLFVGHASWQPGQLERELAAGAWLVLPAQPEHVFGATEQLWQVALRAIGRRVITLAPGVRFVPPDPSWN